LVELLLLTTWVDTCMCLVRTRIFPLASLDCKFCLYVILPEGYFRNNTSVHKWIAHSGSGTVEVLQCTWVHYGL